ncbi:MAG: type II secretion system F family protein [Schwartzia sp.]|nr:type II secretion system F family protein [Schwartzia sp. (in: firmicutes)]
MSANAMTEYDYKARDAAGRMSRGRLRAASKREAAKRLSDGGLFVVRLRPARMAWRLEKRPDRRFPVLLCRRLAVMLSAGVTIGEALRVLSEQETKGAGERILKGLYRAVSDGERLSEAMGRWPQVFTPRITALVDAGERSGSLDILLERLADSLESEYAAREKLLTLMMYPCVLAAAVAMAAGFLMMFVFPVFVSMFQTLSIELPLPTRLLLETYDFLSMYGLWLLLAVVVLVVCAIRMYRKEAFRVRVDRGLIHCPVLGNLILSAERTSLADTFSVLLSSGLVIDQALAIVQGVAENAFLRQGLRRAHSEVQKGYPLSQALRQSEIFSPMHLELLATGEAAGELEAMLAKIASYCRLDMDTRAERIRVLLPPIALLILGSVVGFIIFSTVLPLLDSMTAFM